MSVDVVRLDALDPTTVAVTGGKAAGLARLVRAGFAVPAGFVVTTGALARFEAVGRQWPVDLLEAVLGALAHLAPLGEPVAVRSSAVDEDGAARSFAGQYLTLLDVRGGDAVLDAIVACLDSLHGPAATAYRAAGDGAAPPAMAVIVQRMVRAETAGVAFTVDPATGERDRVVVEAVRGSGEALVGGVAEADRFVLARAADLAVLDRHRAGADVLDEAAARRIASAALRIEAAFATGDAPAPLDIEFAIEQGRLWFLQARPVTAAAPGGEGWTNAFDTPTDERDLWTSANIGEVLPGLLTPLTITAFAANADRAYVRGYQRLRMLAKDEAPRFVGFFYNRAFLNVDSTRLIAERALGTSGDAMEHRFLGGLYSERVRRDHSWTTWKRRLLSAIPLFRLMFTITRDGRRIDRATRAMERRVLALDVGALSNAELEAWQQRLQAFVIRTFAVHLQASGCAGAGYDFIERLLRPLLGEETAARVPVLFSGMRDVESARIAVDAWELARVAREQGLADAVAEPGFEPAVATLPAAWRTAWARFLDWHGHRGVHEMEPARPNWRQDPRPALDIVAAYTTLPEAQAPPQALRRQERERLAFTRELAGRMHPLRRIVFRRLLREAQRWVALRERTKSVIVRGTRLSDFILPEMARRLVAAGTIAREADLFYLTGEELTAALLAEAPPDLRVPVARRRREFERNRYVLLPERFRGRPAPLAPEHGGASGETLTGTPVSPGRITGRARVVHDPRTDGPIEPGEILVAPVTDAGWTPLFALAAGLVVDRGSALSHGSTVAREYGLPAVVNVRRGTTAIRTGDIVTVDGGRGTVTIMQSAG